jgi:hypothetical protein
LSEADPHEEPQAASEDRNPGRFLGARSDRRERAWQRVRELEERAARLVPLPDAGRMKELIEAGDVEALRRLTEELEQANEEREAAIVEAPKARRRAMLQFELPVVLQGLLILAAVSAINSLWLKALGVDYFESYLQSGFLVSLLFGVVAVAIDLDSNPNLIAAHPFHYGGGVLELYSKVYAALSNVLRPPRSDRRLAEAGLPTMGLRYRSRTLDLALTLLFTWSFFAATVAWAVLVAPLQYWVNLVCGAPAREALASSRTLWVVRSANRTELLFAPKDPDEFERCELAKAHQQGEMTEVGFAAKPVSFTAAISAAVLFGVSQLV